MGSTEPKRHPRHQMPKIIIGYKNEINESEIKYLLDTMAIRLTKEEWEIIENYIPPDDISWMKELPGYCITPGHNGANVRYIFYYIVNKQKTMDEKGDMYSRLIKSWIEHDNQYFKPDEIISFVDETVNEVLNNINYHGYFELNHAMSEDVIEYFNGGEVYNDEGEDPLVFSADLSELSQDYKNLYRYFRQEAKKILIIEYLSKKEDWDWRMGHPKKQCGVSGWSCTNTCIIDNNELGWSHLQQYVIRVNYLLIRRKQMMPHNQAHNTCKRSRDILLRMLDQERYGKIYEYLDNDDWEEEDKVEELWGGFLSECGIYFDKNDYAIKIN